MLYQADIKKIAALHLKKMRDAEQRFVVEGEKSIDELLKNGIYEIEKLFILKDLQAKYPNAEVISTKEMGRISQLKNAGAALATVKYPKQVVKATGAWWLVLDDVQDPGNVGALIRIASWFGYAGVFCSEACADFYNPKVVQATMGSLFQVQLKRGDVRQFLSELKQDGYPVLVADMDGENYSKVTVPEKGIVLVGNEGHGPKQAFKDLASTVVTIPRIGIAESLNVGVAAGILAAHFN